ncbi:hypothetical protein BGX33_001337 [Mortierella sp. NVP41]|nr:hypothetical protein BGX33_001337 [Mortierella sp. NVP41]
MFIVDQTEVDVYLGVYPDKRPRPLNASAKRRKKKKKKKKPTAVPGQEEGVVVQEQVVVEEEVAPPMQVRQIRGPTFDQHSVPGFHMAAIDSPWRHRMSYTLEWTADDDMREHIGAAMTRAEEMRQEQGRQQQKDMNSGSLDNGEDDKDKAVDQGRLRGALSMDFQLIPLDQAKSNELLLTRVPVSSFQAHIQLRPEVLPGWYRLQIQFWEDSASSQDCNLSSSPSTASDSESSTSASSDILFSPGRPKQDAWASCFPRQVGVWRSQEAIEVTELDPKDLEWEEFIETLSRKTQFSSPPSSSSSSPSLSFASPQRILQQRAILREEHLAVEEFREPKPAVVSDVVEQGLGLGRFSGLHHRIYGFLANPWGFRTTGPEEFVGPNVKDVVPDFLVTELEDFEEAAMETLELKHEGPIYPMSEWDLEIERLQELMEIWNRGAVVERRGGDIDGGGDDVSEATGDENREEEVVAVKSRSSLGGLHPRIWQGAIEMDSQATVTWRSNRDRIISWRIPSDIQTATAADDSSTFLLDIELVAIPVTHQQQHNGVKEEDRTTSTLSSSQSLWTRAAMSQVAL